MSKKHRSQPKPIAVYEGNDKAFRSACEKSGLSGHKITRRQYAKWRQGRGLARLAQAGKV